MTDIPPVTRGTTTPSDAGQPAPVAKDPHGSGRRKDEPGVGEIKARSQWELFRRKFVRHKLAMGSAIFLFLVIIMAVFAEQIAPYAYEEIVIARRSQPPTFENWHLFGTDQIGRDYFSRVIYGMRTSLQVAAVVGVLATTIGVLVGAIAGYYRGWVDAILMRITDLVIILPFLVVLLVIARYYGGGRPIRIAVILALLVWPSLARITRGVFLSLREKEFVQAARASGAGDLRIMFRHMLPNTIGPILVNLTLVVAAAIIAEATLAFLGLGVQPPTPALGLLMEEGRGSAATLPWLIIFPGLVLVAITLAINFIGDGLRDAVDPTQQET